jgi:hypothetical protein
MCSHPALSTLIRETCDRVNYSKDGVDGLTLTLQAVQGAQPNGALVLGPLRAAGQAGEFGVSLD